MLILSACKSRIISSETNMKRRLCVDYVGFCHIVCCQLGNMVRRSAIVSYIITEQDNQPDGTPGLQRGYSSLCSRDATVNDEAISIIPRELHGNENPDSWMLEQQRFNSEHVLRLIMVDHGNQSVLALGWHKTLMKWAEMQHSLVENKGRRHRIQNSLLRKRYHETYRIVQTIVSRLRYLYAAFDKAHGNVEAGILVNFDGEAVLYNLRSNGRSKGKEQQEDLFKLKNVLKTLFVYPYQLNRFPELDLANSEPYLNSLLNTLPSEIPDPFPMDFLLDHPINWTTSIEILFMERTYNSLYEQGVSKSSGIQTKLNECFSAAGIPKDWAGYFLPKKSDHKLWQVYNNGKYDTILSIVKFWRIALNHYNQYDGDRMDREDFVKSFKADGFDVVFRIRDGMIYFIRQMSRAGRFTIWTNFMSQFEDDSKDLLQRAI